ncbi:MAG: class I SAM-dependent methyltransferase [Clostridia bacterium]
MLGYTDFAYVYDRLTGNVDYESRFNYIVNLLAENGRSKGILLDLACGTGTLTEMLAAHGYDTIGVDGSDDMLAVAREKLIDNQSEILYLCQEMSELDLFGTIDVCVCTLDSLNHITDEETLREVFRRVSLFMEDEGIFLFDVNTPYKHEKILGDNTFVYDMDGVFCTWQNSFAAQTCTTTINLDIFECEEAEDDEEDDVYYRYSESFCEKGYELELLKTIAQENKFEVVAVYDEMTHDDLCETSQRAYFVCKKHGLQ